MLNWHENELLRSNEDQLDDRVFDTKSEPSFDNMNCFLITLIPLKSLNKQIQAGEDQPNSTVSVMGK